MKRVLLVALMLIFVVWTLAGCGSKSSPKVELQMAPLDELPQSIRTSPINVREAYQFAVANPDILQKIPCYCGCGGVGHQNNYHCYVQEDDRPNGNLLLDSHAFG